MKRICAAFFTGVYLFVALFSQNFHNHGSGAVFKDFNFKKAEKTYTSNYSAESNTDCLSCHILYTGNFHVPQDYQIDFYQTGNFKQETFAYEQRFSKRSFFSFQLRGPPVNFI